jgi:type VI secretion system protein ImpL
MAGAQGQPAGMDRIRDLFGGLYAAMANIAAAPDPGQAAFQLVQRRVKDPNNDAFGALRADSAVRPEPVRTIMNDIAASTWGALLKQAHDYVDGVWTREVVPICQGVIFQRYPLYAAATDDVPIKDFGDFFRRRWSSIAARALRPPPSTAWRRRSAPMRSRNSSAPAKSVAHSSAARVRRRA